MTAQAVEKLRQAGWIIGECWLWCRRSRVPVKWIGPVQTDGEHAPLYACADCCAEMAGRVAAYRHQRDRAHRMQHTHTHL